MKKITGVLTASLAVMCLFGCSKKNAAKNDVPSQNELAAALGELLASSSDSEDESWSTESWDDLLGDLTSVSGTKAELQDPIEISFGDFDAMQEFSKKAQNGGFAEGQVVTIDGELSVFNTSVSIGQRNDGEFIGTSLTVDGWKEDDIPEDGSRVKVKATLKRNPDYFFLYLTASSADVNVIAAPDYWSDF